MGLISKVRGLLGLEQRVAGGYSLRDPALAALFRGQESDSGVVVNEASALQSSPVWAATRVISEGVACLPLKLYERQDGGRRVAVDHPLYGLLHDQPNQHIPAMPFREALQAHALLWGNGFAEIERDVLGRPLALWILPPQCITVDQDEDGAPRYIYRHPKHGQMEFGARDIFHLRGLGFDGMQGYSVVAMARDSLGLTMAAEKFGAKFFGQGARPSGVVTLPGHLSDEAFARLKRDFAATHSGIANSHRVAFLEQGMQWQTIGIPPEDAQFLQTRSFQICEVARWFNIPVSKLRDSGGANYASLEQENMSFLAETLRPWLIRWEQEISAKLLLKHEKPAYYAEHLVDAILRVDLAARYNAYAIGRNWGWLSVNDIRAKEGMDPVEGGDVYLQPLNMQPLQAPAGPSAPTATPAVGVAPPPQSPPAPTAGAPADAETNQLEPGEAAKRLAEAMTEHQIMACEHGKTNRCPICGIKKERELVPPAKPGGEHAWAFKWVAI